MQELTFDEIEGVNGGTVSGDIAMGLAGGWVGLVAGMAIVGPVGGVVGFALGAAVTVGYAMSGGSFGANPNRTSHATVQLE